MRTEPTLFQKTKKSAYFFFHSFSIQEQGKRSSTIKKLKMGDFADLPCDRETARHLHDLLVNSDYLIGHPEKVQGGMESFFSSLRFYKTPFYAFSESASKGHEKTYLHIGNLHESHAKEYGNVNCDSNCQKSGWHSHFEIMKLELDTRRPSITKDTTDSYDHRGFGAGNG